MMSSYYDKLCDRTKVFARDVVFLCREIQQAPETKTICYQLIRSSTSVAANYRALRRARSRKEWYAKLSIVIEEIDETCFWLDFLAEMQTAPEAKRKVLLSESEALTKIFAKTRSTAKNNDQRKSE